MKAFRIKLRSENTLTSSVDFIFLEKCLSIDVDYSLLEESAVVEIHTITSNKYLLKKSMTSVEFLLFESKIKKFQIRDDLFFDLGEFVVKVESMGGNLC
mgnify:CR=1 FL=1|jgi:hypothetical protein